MTDGGRPEDPDRLAFGRAPHEFRHAILVERPNGDGGRSLLRLLRYEHFDRVRLDAAAHSSHRPLADVAGALHREEKYHFLFGDARARRTLRRATWRRGSGRCWRGSRIPELPSAITDLGMARDVRVEEDRVRVRLIPTYSACPALEVIAADVRRRLTALAGVRDATVEITYDEPWTAAEMTDEGRRPLTAHGLSVPRRRIWEDPVACPFCRSTATTLENLFDPTLCRAIYYWRACGNPVRRFKPPVDDA